MSSVYCAAFCLSTCVATWDTRHAWTGRGAGAAHLYLIFFQHSREQQIMVGKKNPTRPFDAAQGMFRSLQNSKIL